MKKILLLFTVGLLMATSCDVTPLSPYEEWAKCRGIDLNEDGKIGYDDFMIAIKGEDGKDGLDGLNAYQLWLIDVSNGLVWPRTGEEWPTEKTTKEDYYLYLTGQDGIDGINGLTPEIKNGYWWIGDENTGIKAIGLDGKNGSDGTSSVVTIVDGYWYINGINTEIPAVGENGQDWQFEFAQTHYDIYLGDYIQFGYRISDNVELLNIINEVGSNPNLEFLWLKDIWSVRLTMVSAPEETYTTEYIATFNVDGKRGYKESVMVTVHAESREKVDWFFELNHYSGNLMPGEVLAFNYTMSDNVTLLDIEQEEREFGVGWNNNDKSGSIQIQADEYESVVSGVYEVVLIYQVDGESTTRTKAVFIHWNATEKLEPNYVFEFDHYGGNLLPDSMLIFPFEISDNITVLGHKSEDGELYVVRTENKNGGRLYVKEKEPKEPITPGLHEVIVTYQVDGSTDTKTKSIFVYWRGEEEPRFPYLSVSNEMYTLTSLNDGPTLIITSNYEWTYEVINTDEFGADWSNFFELRNVKTDSGYYTIEDDPYPRPDGSMQVYLIDKPNKELRFEIRFESKRLYMGSYPSKSVFIVIPGNNNN
jgi:hypothetical protein